MMSRFQRPLATMARSFSTSGAKNNKVAVMGASGGKPEQDFQVIKLVKTN